MKILVILFSLVLISNTCHASVEGVLELSKISLHSNGIGESGSVSIFASKGKNKRYTSFVVKAFGKEYKLSNSDLNKLAELAFNGIQISYETGYEILGGKTLYIILQSGFTSGIKKKVLITITESGSIAID
ncbi:MAG: hypothetical protein MJE63_24110 [Proteobacteria bacterium]|nr:hypothetical protein [Pseudomonadota bacterium]